MMTIVQPVPKPARPLRWVASLSFACLLLVAAGCSGTERKTRHLNRANEHFSEGRHEEAVIEYLNVLRYEPRHPESIRNLGMAWCELGSFDKAAPCLLETRRTNPEDVEVRLKLGALYMWAQQTDRAREEAQGILEIDATNLAATLLLCDAARTDEQVQEALADLATMEEQHGTEPNFHLARGNLLARRQEAEAAEQAYARAAELAPENVDIQIARAMFDNQNGRTSEAESGYKRAIELAPDRPSVSARYAAFLSQAGRLDEARTLLNDLRGRFPEFLTSAYLLIELELADKKYEVCRSILSELAGQTPSSLQLGLLHSQVELADQQADAAIAVLEKLDGEFPESAVVHLQLAKAHLLNREIDPAGSYLESARKLDPNLSEATLLLANVKTRQGNLQEALKLLEPLDREYTQSPEVKSLLATAYARMGLSSDAKKVMDELLALRPTDPKYHLAKAGFLLQERQIDQAVEAIDRAISLQPDYAPALSRRIGIDMAQGKSEEALARIDAWLADQPESGQLHFLKALVYMNQKEFDSAEAALLEAIRFQPDLAAAYLTLSRLYVETGRLDDAQVRAEDALKVNSNDVSSLMVSGLLLERKGLKDEARDRYESLLQISPDFVPALNNLAYYYTSHSIDLERAHGFARRARSLRPVDPYVADTLGWILYQQGEITQALPLLEESATAMPDQPEVRYHVGLARLAAGDEAGARDALGFAASHEKDFSGRETAARLVKILAIDPATADPDKTLAVLRRIQQAQPDLALVTYRLGQIEAIQGNAVAASNAFYEVIQRFPSFTAAAHELAWLYADAFNDPERALYWARHARERVKDNITYADTLAWMALRSGDPKWALSLSLQVAEQAGESSRAAYHFAWAQFMVGHLDEAETLLAKAVGNLPTEKEDRAARQLQELIALAKDPLSMQDDEEVKLRDRPALENQKLPALYALARYHEALGEDRDATGLYQEIVDLYPEFSPATVRLANYYSNDPERLNEAFTLCLNARNRSPDDLEVAALYGRILYLRGEYSAAVPVLARCSEINRQDLASRYFLGLSHAQLEEPGKAVETLRSVISEDPDFEFAPNARRVMEELESGE